MKDGDFFDENGVVSFTGDGSRINAPRVAKIESYWNEVRGNRLVPTRSEIDPRGLTGALSHAFVLERIAKGLARFRVSGSHLTDLLGLEARGMPLSTMFTPAARDTLADAVESAFEDPSIIHMEVSAETGFGRPALSGRLTLLPMRSDLGDVSRLLGGLEMAGEIGRAPRRLQIEAQARRGLTGQGEPQAFSMKPQSARPTSSSRSGSGTTGETRRQGFLTLVVDNT